MALLRTLSLVGAATIVGLGTSLLLGYMSAIKKHTWLDYVIRGLSFIGISWASFWLGLLIIYVAAVELQLSSIIDGDSVVTFIGAVITLSIWFSGLYTRRFRGAFIEELNKDYMMAAKILGVPGYKRFFYYLLPNVSLTVLPMLGLSIGSMLAGSTVIEAIFGWRGIGYYMVSGIISRDYPVIQAYVLYVSFIFIMITLWVDIAVIALEPRRRKGGDD